MQSIWFGSDCGGWYQQPFSRFIDIDSLRNNTTHHKQMTAANSAQTNDIQRLRINYFFVLTFVFFRPVVCGIYQLVQLCARSVGAM